MPPAVAGEHIEPVAFDLELHRDVDPFETAQEVTVLPVPEAPGSLRRRDRPQAAFR
jgi:hypothetical protein